MKIITWFIPLLVLGTFLWTRQARDRFKIAHISSSVEYHSEWNTKPLEKHTRDIEAAFSQDYAFLGSGYQCFAFVSRDDKYVIKFFRHHKWRLTSFEKLLGKAATLERKKKRTFNRTFNSSIIAHTDFSKQTGLIYLHLNKTTDLSKRITISDERNRTFQINLDDYEFVIQRKATPIGKYLSELREKENHDEAKQVISSLLRFIAHRIEKGYRDKDPHPIRNFGVLEGEIIQIDIGGYEKDDETDPEYFSRHEIPKIRRKFLKWANENYPELSHFTSNEIKALLKPYRPQPQ